jgi:AraC family transcriptional regulator
VSTQATATPWDQYRKRIDRVIAHIHANLSEPLTTDALAEVAHLSPYHWHRIYRAITGESAAATVKRSRMHKAASDLVRTDLPIAQIAASVGVPEVHSFTRTFKKYYGITPGAFRKSQPPLNNDGSTTPDTNASLHPVELVHKPDMPLVGLWHYGDYMTIGETFEKVMAQSAMAGILPSQPVTQGVYMADPDIHDTARLTSFAGVQVSQSTAIPEGLEELLVPGGRFAMMTHRGAYALLANSYQWLYGCWLPQSELAVRDVPCFEIYLNSPVDTPAADLATAICLGIE